MVFSSDLRRLLGGLSWGVPKGKSLGGPDLRLFRGGGRGLLEGLEGESISWISEPESGSGRAGEVWARFDVVSGRNGWLGFSGMEPSWEIRIWVGGSRFLGA